MIKNVIRNVLLIFPNPYLLTLPYYFLYYFSFSTFTEIKIELNKLYGQPMIKFTK